MSSLISHIFIALALLFIFSSKLNLKPKEIILFSIFAIVPDLDAFMFVHRVAFHNIFFMVIIIALIYCIFNNLKTALIVGFYLLSHLILDFTDGGASLLHPITSSTFYMSFGIMLKDFIFTPIFSYGVVAHVLPQIPERAVLSSENFGMIILALILVIFIVAKDLYIKKVISSSR